METNVVRGGCGNPLGLRENRGQNSKQEHGKLKAAGSTVIHRGRKTPSRSGPSNYIKGDPGGNPARKKD